MSQLPFVVAPKRKTQIVSALVNGEECSLEFPVYGSILAGEAIYIADHEYQGIIYRESSRLADALLQNTGQLIEAGVIDGKGDAEMQVQRLGIRMISIRMGIPIVLSPAEQRLMLHENQLIADIQGEIATAYKKQVLRTVTAAISHRFPSMEKWSDDDSARLPEPLQEAIYNFVESERNGGAVQKTPEEIIDDMVEALGKPNPNPTTGDKPIGTAESSGHMPENLKPTALRSTRSTTSKRRSGKESNG
jgi:hypothetical protein